ncbi:hypothetical protein F8M41_014782, partial [Gigaspora margarita]
MLQREELLSLQQEPIDIRGRRDQIPTQLIENMFLDEDDDDLVEDHYDEQEINFDTPDNDNTYKDIDMSNNQPHQQKKICVNL